MAAKKKPVSKLSDKREKPIGKVTHFYTAIKVGIVKLKQPLKVGASLRFRGATTDFSEKVNSMQFDHKPIRLAKKNQEVGMKLKRRVREGDEVYLAS